MHAHVPSFLLCFFLSTWLCSGVPVVTSTQVERYTQVVRNTNTNTNTNKSSPVSKPKCEENAPFRDFINGWWVLFITLATALPWAIVAVWDAVDKDYRTRDEVSHRLLLSTCCLLLAYSSGLIFTVCLTYYLITGCEKDRHDEIATVAALLLFNVWHVGRNVFGWLQFFSIRKLKRHFIVIQRNFASCFRGQSIFPKRKPCIQGLEQVRISNRLFDNEWGSSAPYLSPFFKVDPPSVPEEGNPPTPEFESWSIALWRMWWTQDTSARHGKDFVLHDSILPCGERSRKPNVADLLESDPAGLTPFLNERGEYEIPFVKNDQTEESIINKYDWAEALLTYGTPKGQQDTHGDAIPNVMDTSTTSGIATLVHEKTYRIPNRMSALWYNTRTFEEKYNKISSQTQLMEKHSPIMFPTWSSWLSLAQSIGAKLEHPVYLSDVHLTMYAGELASASLILVRYNEKYAELVDIIHRTGLDARWTFGWSGLLACFSHLWTTERIFVAMLNGLSLLALQSTADLAHLDPNVISMLYGYAAFEISDRAVGKRIAEDRKAELLRRYAGNKGKTCRGSGLCAIRMACKVLGLPAEASHMDGLPAFSAGWASEYIERKPGNQTPEHGFNHDEVEARHGSSNAWRYPHTQT